MNHSGVVKSRWTDEETSLLEEAVKLHGAKNWRFIATFVPNRNAKQCRERWNVFLDPEFSREKWTEEEDNILKECHALHGNKWSDFTKHLPTRSCVSIRNRWACLSRRMASHERSSGESIETMEPQISTPDAHVIEQIFGSWLGEELFSESLFDLDERL